MKIYINRRPVDGPWGGGSKVLAAIVKECIDRNHQVFFEEEIRRLIDIDVYFCMDPRPKETSVYEELLNRRYKNNSSRLVHRIGDLGTHGKPELYQLIKSVIGFADLVIFPSIWAENYAKFENIKRSIVIQNAPNQIFIENKRNCIIKDELRIVTHHWSNNDLKGFDFYERLDEYCLKHQKVKFSFIGRKPDSVVFQNYVPPLDMPGLVNEIPKHNLYLTASRQEAGANHVLEAMALGLPVMYHKDGGSIVEYCKDFGIEFESFEGLIDIIENKIDVVRDITSKTSITRGIREMAKEYVDSFEAIREN